MANLTNEQIKALQEKHNKLREILIEYGCEEYGDCIVDDICTLFDEETTLAYYEEE